ncbi:LADA_0C03444g1_1 [Lachancea dasiensis]|uniref:LADA_0C03444g1_1 n=1 Tax=Lachancea dasiensis TaxID=1072105 RepID=A0A1G4IYW7_9SACH|nr:LADA_0C03444g1_1 [Lachancea dasiensis]
MDQSFPLETHGHSWLQEEEEEEEEVMLFPSYPKRFRASDSAETAGSEDGSSDQCSSGSAPDIESLLDKDDSVTTNADFWREVPVSSEFAGDEPAAVVDPGSACDAELATVSPLASPQEPRLEDFIQDVEPSLSAGPSSYHLQSDYACQSDFQIKRLCFRDADGKLALTDASRSSSLHHISKPLHKRLSNCKTSKKLLKRALRRKSGFWEMASPAFAVAEFMLL